MAASTDAPRRLHLPDAGSVGRDSGPCLPTGGSLGVIFKDYKESEMPTGTDNDILIEIADLMDSRANVYKVLSRGFREEMDEDFARELADDFAFESSDGELYTVLAEVKASLDGVDEGMLEQLAVVFDRVFFGMGPITARHAFPYESVYTSDKGILMQDAYTQVVRTYREEHLAKDASFREPEDHLAVELAFMATLAERTATFLREGHEQAAQETIRQQINFLQDHLLNWIDMFCADLIKADDGGFYGSLAQFSELFLHKDASLLSEMVD